MTKSAPTELLQAYAGVRQDAAQMAMLMRRGRVQAHVFKSIMALKIDSDTPTSEAISRIEFRQKWRWIGDSALVVEVYSSDTLVERRIVVGRELTEYRALMEYRA